MQEAYVNGFISWLCLKCNSYLEIIVKLSVNQTFTHILG